ncbi:hypothetical protein B5807_02035 [Epicoccum nigrum]|uniref:GRAM domain-containing protein n=1 Tax=Epicoccum nigrum TaxID=105696 RepID=A0A1Y2MAE5_EPING|nr:hypothetical protein B5807_02035 [Epicoccum nigrum]
MQEHPPEPAPENVFEIGLDRARIDSAAHIQYPESNLTDEQSASSDSDSRSPRTSHSVIESIKQKRHKAGAKIRRSLHIGRASDDRGLSTTAIVKDGEHSDSRYAFDPPERDHATFKDFLHNPLDTVKSKVSEQGNQEFAGNLTAKEVPHGDEVEIVRAADAVEAAGTDAQRLLAIQDLAKLLKERQASYARWTFDRHITKVRVLPRDKSELKPRSAFETYDPLEGVVIDWRAYGQHLLELYAQKYGGQYIGYGSDPPVPSKSTAMPNIERFLVASAPIQELIMTARRIYRWEDPPKTVKYLAIYSVLWYFNMLLPGCLAFFVYRVIERREHGNTIEDLREDIVHREDQRTTALSLTELIVKEGDENWSDDLVNELGPWFMIQLADLANLCESLRNFYEWRVPHRTTRVLLLLSGLTLSTAIVPMWLLVKTFTFFMGFSFFALYPIATNFPEYRLLVSPTKQLLWNIPTHAEWAINYIQAEGKLLASTSAKPLAPTPTILSPVFDPKTDYNSYTAHQDNTTGRIIVSTSGLRFVANMGHEVLWSLRYGELEALEKQDRVVTKKVPGKLQKDSGMDLKIRSKGGREEVLKNVEERDEAFSQIVGFSENLWQVVW